jgi:hypothetical protein
LIFSRVHIIVLAIGVIFSILIFFVTFSYAYNLIYKKLGARQISSSKCESLWKPKSRLLFIKILVRSIKIFFNYANKCSTPIIRLLLWHRLIIKCSVCCNLFICDSNY